jgi:hypothetical protein
MTKLATQIGTCSPVKGFTAERPVSKPSFSIAPLMRADAVLHAEAPRLLAERPARRPTPTRSLHERVLGRERHEGGAEDRVDARREDLDAPVAGRAVRLHYRELHAGAFRSPDPVPLHRQHLLGPAVEASRACSSSSA